MLVVYIHIVSVIFESVLVDVSVSHFVVGIGLVVGVRAVVDVVFSLLYFLMLVVL